MDGMNATLRAITLALVLVLMTVASPVETSAQTPEASQETVRDGRIIGILTVPDQTYERTWQMKQGEWTSLSVDCDQCSVMLELDGVSIGVTSTFSGQADEDQTARMTITSPIQEFVSYSLIETIDEANPTVRPSPGEAMVSSQAWMCQIESDCFDTTRSLDSIPSSEFGSEQFLTGILQQNQAEFIAVPVTKGQTLELKFSHLTGDVELQVFFQNETETLLSQGISHNVPLPTNSQTKSEFWSAEEDGRFVIKVSSQSPETAYALMRTVHLNEQTSSMIELGSSLVLHGHHSKTVVIETNDTFALTIEPLYRNFTGQVEQLVSGSWLSATSMEFTHSEASHLYPYPNASAFKLSIDGERFAFELSGKSFADLDSGQEAPTVRPSSNNVSNSSWPQLYPPADGIEGELTLAIHDTADVFKIEVTGYESSIHLIQVKVLSEELEHLQLELWDIDQTTWEVVDERVVQPVNGKLQTALELQPGTHFARISHVDVANATNHSWGSNVDRLPYVLSTAYTMIDEGDEPYFPPDDSTVKWGEVARWVMGLLFLVPCLYFALLFSADRKLAQELSIKTAQLQWFKSQMDAGQEAPAKLRKSLHRSLQAITQLDWATACDTWGPTDVEHRTDGLAMAVWRLDPRLAKQEGALPIMVGIHVTQGNWELAALRFDAPEGEGWTVGQVEPKFLHRGEEIFVDTMREGNLTFLTLELQGSASAVDIEMNGRCNGEAMAARIPRTLQMISQEEE